MTFQTFSLAVFILEKCHLYRSNHPYRFKASPLIIEANLISLNPSSNYPYHLLIISSVEVSLHELYRQEKDWVVEV